MQLIIITATGRREALDLAQEQLTAAALHAAVASRLGLPPLKQAYLRLVCAGQALADDQAVSKLKDGDSVLAVVAPKPPPREVRQAVAGGGGEEDEDDPLRLRLPANAPAWMRRAVHFLRHRLRVPEAALALALRAGWRFWLGLLAWSAGARLAAAYEVGPVYIVGSLIAGMLLNLGQRREGQWSAYSLFNPGMRRLPGQMTAEDLDAQAQYGEAQCDAQSWPHQIKL